MTLAPAPAPANPILLLDQALIRLTGHIVAWFEEWLSVPQKTLELGCITMMMLADIYIMVDKKVWLVLVITLAMGSALVWVSSLPSTIKAQVMAGPAWVIARVCSWAFVLLAVMTLVEGLFSAPKVSPKVTSCNAAFVVVQVCYMATLYLLSSSFDGERGRKRKAASAKVKEWLAQLDWLPQPQREGAQ